MAIDFSQYNSWPTVTGANGGTYYVVPGSSYVYDPVSSQLTGKTQLFLNPTQANKAAAAAKSASSPLGQLLPVGLGVGGVVAGQEAIAHLAPATAKTVLNGKVVMSDGTLKDPNTGQTVGNINQGAGTTSGDAGNVVVNNSTPPTSANGAFTDAASGQNIDLAPGTDPSTGLTLAPSADSSVVETQPTTAQLFNMTPEQLSNVDVSGADIAADTGLASSFASYGIPAAAAVTAFLAGHSALNMLKGKNDSSIAGEFGRTSLGIATGGLSEVANRLLNGTKSQDQQSRDATRSTFQNNGIADGNYNVTLADGSTYNVGLDGHATLQNNGKNIDGSTTRHPYDVDFSNPLAVASVPELQGLATQILGSGASSKQISDTVGMLSNAVTSNAKSQADVNANIAAIQAKYKNQDPSAGSPAPVVTTPTSTAVPVSTTGQQPVINNTPPPASTTSIPALNNILKVSTPQPLVTSPAIQGLPASKLGEILATRMNIKM